MRVSKKTYTKRRKTRNYTKKSKRKRIRGGEDPPTTPTKMKKSPHSNPPSKPKKPKLSLQLPKRILTKLRKLIDTLPHETHASKADNYKQFNHDDFNEVDYYLLGFANGYKHSENGKQSIVKNEHEPRKHYSDMSDSDDEDTTTNGLSNDGDKLEIDENRLYKFIDDYVFESSNTAFINQYQIGYMDGWNAYNDAAARESESDDE